MGEPPRRWRFQIHLSTAVVMMVVAGGLIWANVSGRRVSEIGHVWYPIGMPMHGDAMGESEFLTSHSSNKYWHGNRGFEFGWPFIARRMNEVVLTRSGETFISKPMPGDWWGGAVIENVLVAVGILFAVWFFCEWGIRRRAAGKGA